MHIPGVFFGGGVPFSFSIYQSLEHGYIFIGKIHRGRGRQQRCRVTLGVLANCSGGLPNWGLQFLSAVAPHLREKGPLPPWNLDGSGN